MKSLLKKGMFIVPLACIFLGGVALAQVQESSPVQIMQGDPVKGATLFEQCASCHGNKVKLSAGLAEGPFVEKLMMIQKKTYTASKPLKMQAKLKALNDQQLYDLASFITKK